MSQAFTPVPVQQAFFAFQGGLDLVTPAMRLDPGKLLLCTNYEPALMGGYTRIGGYEAYDGRPSPSEAVYQAVAATMTATPAYGALLTIGAATCRFLQLITGGILVTNVSGTIPVSTTISDGSNVGTTLGSTTITTPITAQLNATYRVAAADYRRTLIGAVPGSGPVRGVWLHNGKAYAFRNNAGGTAGVMHVASTSGWTAVDLGEEVSFSNANTSVNDGDTLTQGGVTATIRRVVVETGTLASGVNTGRLILTGRSGGNFAAGAATSTGGGNVTLSGAQTAITLPPGGKYRFINHNFFGQQTSICMYGVNGVGRAFEFDGTTFVPLATGAATDTPSYVAANNTYLFVAQGSSVMYCSPGDPYNWTATVGGGEIACGDTITGLTRLPGEALAIFSRNKTSALVGASPLDWSLQNVSPESGAIDDTVAQVRDVYCLDDRGISSIASSQNYGNFEWATVSRVVQSIIDGSRGKERCAVVVRSKNQYRLMYSDGLVLYMLPGQNPVFTTAQYPFAPNVACSGEDAAGVERVLVGADDGFVYDLDRGSTFNGAAIESIIKLAYNNLKTARMRTRFRRGVLEMSAQSYVDLKYATDFNFGDVSVDEHIQDSSTVVGTGGVWGVSNWGNFIYDGTLVASPEVDIAGTGYNFSVLFYANTKLDFGHTLQGMTILHSPRRLQR